MKFKLSNFFRNVMGLGYDGGETSRMRRDLGWGRAQPKDEDSLWTDNSHEMLRQKAFDLRRNNAVVAGVGERIALFTVGATGIMPQAKTSDEKWNREAEAYWRDVVIPGSDFRERESLWRFQWLCVSMRPTHGGMYFEKIQGGKLRPIECERIRDPQKPPPNSPYRNGVRVNKFGQIEGYLVHDRDKDGGFGMEHAERFIAATDMIPVITPPWRADQVREIGDLAPVIPLLQDIHELNKYTVNTAKIQSQYFGFLKRVFGATGAGLGPRAANNVTAGTRQTFKTDWGTVLEGFPQEEMQFLSSPTPQNNHIPHVKLQYALCASALNFPYEFLTLDLSQLDFSRQKGMFLLVNFACRPWKKWLEEKFLAPFWAWRITQAIAKGELPAAPTRKRGEFDVSEFGMVDWQPPEEPWIDRQEAQQSDVLEIQAGLSTLSRASRRRGYDLEDTLREKARDLKTLERIAAEEGVDPTDLVKMQIPGQTEAPKKDDDKENADTEESDENDMPKKEMPDGK